jgi:hypothetical protein
MSMPRQTFKDCDETRTLLMEMSSLPAVVPFSCGATFSVPAFETSTASISPANFLLFDRNSNAMTYRARSYLC